MRGKTVNGCQAAGIMLGGVEYDCDLGYKHVDPRCHAMTTSQVTGAVVELTWATESPRCAAVVYVDCQAWRCVESSGHDGMHNTTTERVNVGWAQ